jgi:chromosome segregation ATPase
MALDIDLDVLKTSLYEASEEASRKYFDTTNDAYTNYKQELKEYTDNLAVLKKEIAEAPADLKQVKPESIALQQRAINSLVDKYKMIMVKEAAEQVKEVLKTVAMTAGKIALSMVMAAV